ncbi:DMT family transporter [bacterium]|nr:DMT family transporter [candidate division CSSED10-310 bacterium]
MDLRDSRWMVHGALIFIQFAFGAFHVMAKYVLGNMHPLAIAGSRVVVATPLLLVIASAVDRKMPTLRDMPRLALLGFLGVFTNQVLFIIGLQYTTATNAGILMPSIPVFAAAFSILTGIEKVSYRKLTGILVAVVGAVVMLDIAGFSFGRSVFFGNALILVNCMSYSLFLVLQKPVLNRLPPLTVIAWAFLFGGAGVFALSLNELMEMNLAALPIRTLWGLAYVVLIPTVVNYALNTWAIRRTTPSLVAAYVTLQPVAAALLAMLVLGERAGLRELSGFAIIITGLFLVSRRRRLTQSAG